MNGTEKKLDAMLGEIVNVHVKHDTIEMRYCGYLAASYDHIAKISRYTVIPPDDTDENYIRFVAQNVSAIESGKNELSI